MKKSSFLFLFFFYQLTFAQLSITGPSTISQNWPYVTFSNYCTSGDTAAYNIWTLPSSSGGYFNFAYGNGNPQAIAAQTKINVEPANNCVSWGDNATWWPFYDIPATISVTNGGMSATKTILMTPNTYGQTVQPLSTITKTACASDSIIVGTVTAYSNYYALQRTGPNEGCRLGHKWYYFDQTTGNWISFLTVNSQPSISGCSNNFSCLDSVTGKASQLFGYNVIDSTEWFNGIIKLDISQVPSNLADSLQVYLEVQHKQGVVLSSDTLQLNILPTPVTSVSANGPLTFCLGDSVVLTAAGGSSYSWSTGDTAQSITVKSAGNYSVTAIGQGNQCNGNTVSTTVNLFPVINTPTLNTDTLFQMSGSTMLVTTSPSSVNYSYQWGARGGVVIASGHNTQSGYAYIDLGAPDTNAAVWVIISNGYCTDSVGIDIVIISGVSLDDNSLNSITLSPNPNSGLFSIQVGQEHIGSSYQILDNLGRLIDKGIIRDLSQDFDLSDKPKGVYRVQVSNEKSVKTLNVVIQ